MGPTIVFKKTFNLTVQFGIIIFAPTVNWIMDDGSESNESSHKKKQGNSGSGEKPKDQTVVVNFFAPTSTKSEHFEVLNLQLSVTSVW